MSSNEWFVKRAIPKLNVGAEAEKTILGIFKAKLLQINIVQGLSDLLDQHASLFASRLGHCKKDLGQADGLSRVPVKSKDLFDTH